MAPGCAEVSFLSYSGFSLTHDREVWGFLPRTNKCTTLGCWGENAIIYPHLIIVEGKDSRINYSPFIYQGDILEHPPLFLSFLLSFFLWPTKWGKGLNLNPHGFWSGSFLLSHNGNSWNTFLRFQRGSQWEGAQVTCNSGKH